MKVAVLGGGQLGRMLALAGHPLGVRFRFLDPAADAPAADLGGHLQAGYEDPRALTDLAGWASVVTWDFENVPASAASWLARHVRVHPPPAALQVSQDRLDEKVFLREMGVPVPDFAAVGSREDLGAAVATVGLPAVLKTRRFGYDGKGQVLLREPADAAPAWERLGGAPLVLESWVPFDRELSLIAVRGRGGETAFYPLVENRHGDGILRLTRAPAPSLTPELQEQAARGVRRILDRLDYVGVLTLELFQVGSRLLGNEIAPRVHNSGHWTIEGAQTSQFENHLRAILGLPLGSTELLAETVMVNLIGRLPPTEPLLAIPGVHLHLYGKTPRPGRKLGHVTVRAADVLSLDQRLGEVLSVIGC